jgi:membrane protease YdiL (CAAX protease family)
VRVAATLRIEPLGDDPDVLFEFRRCAGVPVWAQIVLVTGLFLATIFLTHDEYVRRGTVFGFAGAGFNALICPIYEELIFRGWILGRLARRRSALPAIAVSSLLFGLFHLRNIYWLEPWPLFRMVATHSLLTGPVLGWVALRCRSAWPAVILHYLNNLTYYLRH